MGTRRRGRGVRVASRRRAIPARHAVAATSALLVMAGAGVALAAGGTLVQQAGRAGCIAEGPAGRCAGAPALARVGAVTVSPDGRHVYAASLPAALATLDRDPATGALTQKPGTAGCASATEIPGCSTARALGRPADLAVSPDGRSLYVASFVSDAIAVFDRDVATGTLTQKPGPEGCIGQPGSLFGTAEGECTRAYALEFPSSVVLGPDANHVYVTGFYSDAVVILRRDVQTGALTQLPGRSGCISETGTKGTCANGRTLRGAYAIALSADGRNAYVAAIESGLAIFDRDPATGALKQKRGRAGCVTAPRRKGSCTISGDAPTPGTVAVSADGKSVYVAGVEPGSALAIFDRDPRTGTLRQKRGRAGCIAVAPSGTCARGVAIGGFEHMTMSRDDKRLYAVSTTYAAVVVFARNRTTGALRQLPGRRGCISDDGTRGACTRGRGLGWPVRIATSPDDRSAYVASDSRGCESIPGRSSCAGNGVAIFDRR